MKVTIYPRLPNKDNIRTNPYINDFIHALEQLGIKISNAPDKNPLFSLLLHHPDSDAYIFHWLENVPDYKYGILQTMAAIWLLCRIKCRHKKIAWFLHNKQPHLAKHKFSKNLLRYCLLHQADLIVTHASEGVEVVCRHNPAAKSRTVFLHHPTKNRMVREEAPMAPKTDLLIWGNISGYKGVPEFLRFATEKQWTLKIKVIGKCSTDHLFEELKQYANEHVILENRSIPFDELGQEIHDSRFVLIPYASESILSSGVLMDSLSFGARVIGPDVGSFRDYAKEPQLNVYTFHTFSDIPAIMQRTDEAVDREAYHHFLKAHNWERFGQDFYYHLQHIIQQ